MSQLTLTVDTTDTLVLSEASLMLERLSTNGGLKQNMVVSVQPTPVETPLPSVTVASIPEPEDDVATYSEGELDSAGMPWDERIHASTKSKVKDGTWTFRRGLDEATKQAVLAEYTNPGLSVMPSNDPIVMQLIEATTESTPPPPPPVSDEVTPPPPPPVSDEVTPPPPPPMGDEEITTLPQFLKAVRAKSITPAQVQEACNIIGAANPISLGADPEKLAEAVALLGL